MSNEDAQTDWTNAIDNDAKDKKKEAYDAESKAKELGQKELTSREAIERRRNARMKEHNVFSLDFAAGGNAGMHILETHKDVQKTEWVEPSILKANDEISACLATQEVNDTLDRWVSK